MDKNYGDVVVGAGEVGLVIYAEPLAKAEFFERVISGARTDTVYVDFDLMYSGHVASGMLPGRDNVEVVVPGRDSVRKAVAGAILRASQGNCLVVIDSLNGMRRVCRGRDDAAANTALMMLASFARQSGASVLIACAAIRDSGSEWWLSPVGGRIGVLGTGVTKLYVRPADDGIEIEALAGPAEGGYPNSKHRYAPH